MNAIRAFFRPFNILNWPIWLKLSAGFVVAIVTPAVIIALVVLSAMQFLGEQNLRAYIEEQGERQQVLISDAFSQAGDILNNFRSILPYQRAIGALLEADTPRSADMDSLGRIFQNTIISSDMFNRIRLVNLDGRIIAEATINTIRLTPIENREAPAFLQASTALVEGKEETISILGSPFTVEAITVVNDASGRASGFLIGSVNIDQIIFNKLQYAGGALPANTFLVSAGLNPVMLTASGQISEVPPYLASSPAVERALRGESGLEAYQGGLDGQTPTIGFYAPIYYKDTAGQALFALVTETRAAAWFERIASYFNGARLFPLAVGLALVLVVLVLLFNQVFTPPLLSLRQAIQAMARGSYDEPLKSAARGDEIGEVSAAFTDMRTQVKNLLDDLQARVAARTRDIAATQEISRQAATQHNLQNLMDQVVQLIVEQFPNIYHAQIFLLDAERTYAVLRASTGEVGKLLLARGHRLAVGSISVIGQVIEQQQNIIARDTATSQVHRRNEFLPDTRAELAIPLHVGNRIIGALDVQSKYRNAFTDDEVTVLQTMADQIAVAIENARLYQESIRRLEDIERANRMATLATWQEYIYGQRRRQLDSAAGLPTGIDLSDLRQKALQQGRIVVGEITSYNSVPIAVPIQLRGQVLGAVEWELPADDVSENKLQLAQELANRLAVSLENARLFEESQRAAERERIVNSIAAKLTPQTEISEILQTAVREVGQALRAPQVNIRLHPKNGSSNGKHEPSNDNQTAG